MMHLWNEGKHNCNFSRFVLPLIVELFVNCRRNAVLVCLSALNGTSPPCKSSGLFAFSSKQRKICPEQ